MHIFVFKESSDYKNFSNLKTTEMSSMGYMAKLDKNSCGQVNITLPWTIKSEQASSDSSSSYRNEK